VIGEPTLELAVLFLVALGSCLGGCQLIDDGLAPPLQLRDSRTERPKPPVELIDHIVIGLQCEQRLEILMHSRPPFEIAPRSRGIGLAIGHRLLPR
jgi:hypothetical protein